MYGKAISYPFSHFLFGCCVGTLVLSALHWDVGPLSIQSWGKTVPSLAINRLVPQPKPYVNKPCYHHTASTHGEVDLASSNGHKELGVDGHPIVTHRQI